VTAFGTPECLKTERTWIAHSPLARLTRLSLLLLLLVLYLRPGREVALQRLLVTVRCAVAVVSHAGPLASIACPIGANVTGAGLPVAIAVLFAVHCS